MIIRDIFEKSIDRPLEGVIKVGKNTEEAIYEEVNEYVVTKELRTYFSNFETSVRLSVPKPVFK